MTIKKEEVVSLGIVLKTHPYKESDSLVTVYFKDYGKMTLIARGVKKLKSKNASACQSLTLSEFTFIPRNGLSTMIKASSVDFYRYIKENLELEAYASYFMEFVLKNEERCFFRISYSSRDVGREGTFGFFASSIECPSERLFTISSTLRTE